MQIVFMGSPPFSLPSLIGLAGVYNLIGVVTQPDRPAGRGRKLRPSAVKRWALENDVPILQPDRLRSQTFIEQLRGWKPDLIVVAAYGQIVPKAVLDLPGWGCLNVHASLLPRWRGAAPIQAAVMHNDLVTGVTLMKMDEGLDTGPILSQRRTPIGSTETSGELSSRLAKLGASLLLETLPPYFEGDVSPTPQDESCATYAPMLKKADGELDFSLPAGYLARQVRAYEPWPGSFLTWRGGRLVIRRARGQADGDRTPIGVVTVRDGLPAVGTAEGVLILEVVHPAGAKSMAGDAFLRGAPDFLNSRLVEGDPQET